MCCVQLILHRWFDELLSIGNGQMIEREITANLLIKLTRECQSTQVAGRWSHRGGSWNLLALAKFNSRVEERRKFIDFFLFALWVDEKKERRIKTAILCTRRLSTWTAQQQRARVKPYEKELYVFKREMRSDLEHSLSFQHWKLYICATYENVVEIRNSFRIHQSQLDRWLCFLRWSQHFPSIKRFSHLFGISRRFCDLLHSTFWSCGRFWASSRSRTCVFLVCEFKIA